MPQTITHKTKITSQTYSTDKPNDAANIKQLTKPRTTSIKKLLDNATKKDKLRK